MEDKGLKISLIFRRIYRRRTNLIISKLFLLVTYLKVIYFQVKKTNKTLKILLLLLIKDLDQVDLLKNNLESDNVWEVGVYHEIQIRKAPLICSKLPFLSTNSERIDPWLVVIKAMHQVLLVLPPVEHVVEEELDVYRKIVSLMIWHLMEVKSPLQIKYRKIRLQVGLRIWIQTNLVLQFLV